jgi:integrase
LKARRRGAVAQLGERSVRNAEVEGSIPFRSIYLKSCRILDLGYPPGDRWCGRKTQESRYTTGLGDRPVPVTTSRTPSYRNHKPSGQAVVTLDGRDIYLGRYGTDESRAEYDRMIAEWLTNGRRLPAPNSGTGSDLTVNEMLLAYLRHVDRYYLKNGKPTVEPGNIRLAIRPLRQLHGHTTARDFGPLALKTVRQSMIDSGLCRSEINRRIGRLVRAFKWAVSEEIVPPGVHQALQAVPGLRRGRSDMRESKPIKPVPDTSIEAIRPFVAPQVWAMVELQRLSAMRPGEVVSMRTIDLDTTGNIWTYTPQSHKTEHHGKRRQIHLGPRAQEILRRWLRAEPEVPLFSPTEAMDDRMATRRRERKTPVQPSQRSRAKTKPKKRPGSLYSVESYRRAIAYGCVRAGIARWHPHQLRHSAATRLRKEFGLEVARVVLGHSSAAVTEIYAEIDDTKAADAMGRIG